MAQDDPFYAKPLTRTGTGGKSRVVDLSGRRPLQGAPDGSRGNSFILALPVAGVAESPCIVESPRDAGDDAEVLTITLGLEFQGTETGFNPRVPSNIVCILQWGAGGASYEAEFDWVQGGSISVMASRVRVLARYEAVPQGFAGTLPPAAILTASIGYGSLINDFSLKRRTVNLPLGLLPGVTVVMSIPRFATSVLVLPSGQDLNFQFYSGDPTAGPGQIPLAAFRANSTLASQAFPIPNGAWVVRITNNLGVPTPATAYGCLLWNLRF